MKLSTLFEQSSIDKCLLLYPWLHSKWRNDHGDEVVLAITDIPRSITSSQFLKLCVVSGNADWSYFLWGLLMSQVYENETVIYTTWKEVVEQLLSGDSDFEG